MPKISAFADRVDGGARFRGRLDARNAAVPSAVKINAETSTSHHTGTVTIVPPHAAMAAAACRKNANTPVQPSGTKKCPSANITTAARPLRTTWLERFMFGPLVTGVACGSSPTCEHDDGKSSHFRLDSGLMVAWRCISDQQLALKSSCLGTVARLSQNENWIGVRALFHGHLTNAGPNRGGRGGPGAGC